MILLRLRRDDLYRLCGRSRKEGFTPMPGLVARTSRRHRRKSLILPSVSARRSELLIKKCAARSGNAPKSEARRETAQTEGRAHEPEGGEVTARGRDRRLRHARRRRRHVRGVTERLPSERRTNVVPSRLANMRQVKPSASVTAICVPKPSKPPKSPQRIKRTFLKIMLAS